MVTMPQPTLLSPQDTADELRAERIVVAGKTIELR